MVKYYVGKLTPTTAEILNDPLKDEDDSGKIKQRKNGLYLTLLDALRYVKSGKTYHTANFSCLNEDMLKELKGIKNEILYDRRTTLLNNKLHLINDIRISYGYFLKVYTIQKKFRYLNIGDQEKMKRKQELTSCAHTQFNGMHTIRSISHSSVKKEDKPASIYIDCSVSMKHFDNFYFTIDPRSAFIGHYSDEGRDTKRNTAYQCHYCDCFFRYWQKFNKHIKHCSGHLGFAYKS